MVFLLSEKAEHKNKMKKYYFTLSLFLVFNCSKDDAITFPEQNIITGKLDFIQTLGGSKNDVFKSVVKTTDGGYAILGYSQSKDGDITTKTAENFDFWLLRYTADNMLLWSKTFGGSNDDRGADIIQTNDGGFALFGYSQSADQDVSLNAGSKDFWILKITVNGVISWQKSFGFSGSDYGTALTNTNDNGYLVTGILDVTSSGGLGISRSSQRHAGGDIWAIKLNNTGELEWSNYYGGSFTDSSLGIVKTMDNGFIIAASSDSNDVDISNNKGTYDFWILKITADGTLIWEKNFGGTEIDEASAIAATNDGNFIIVGDTRSSDIDVLNNNGAADIWMIKITADGVLIWEKTIGATGFDVARSISKTQDSGFIISGSSRSSDAGFINKGQNDALLIKINSEGIIEWQETFGGTEIDFLYDAVELNNKTIIAVGESNSNDGDLDENKGFSDGLLLKIK
jgi:predicted Rdx family selenoprotein